MRAHHLNNVSLTARVVFLGEKSEQSTICSNASDLSRLLLHRLEVLQAALYRISELRDKAAEAQAGSDAVL